MKRLLIIIVILPLFLQAQIKFETISKKKITANYDPYANSKILCENVSITNQEGKTHLVVEISFQNASYHHITDTRYIHITSKAKCDEFIADLTGALAAIEGDRKSDVYWKKDNYTISKFKHEITIFLSDPHYDQGFIVMYRKAAKKMIAFMQTCQFS